jgi:hypothetical protein
MGQTSYGNLTPHGSIVNGDQSQSSGSRTTSSPGECVSSVSHLVQLARVERVLLTAQIFNWPIRIEFSTTT